MQAPHPPCTPVLSKPPIVTAWHYCDHYDITEANLLETACLSVTFYKIYMAGILHFCIVIVMQTNRQKKGPTITAKSTCCRRHEAKGQTKVGTRRGPLTSSVSVISFPLLRYTLNANNPLHSFEANFRCLKCDWIYPLSSFTRYLGYMLDIFMIICYIWIFEYIQDDIILGH